MVFSGVLYVFQSAQRHVWVDEVRVAPHKPAPLEIARHRNRTIAQLLYRVVLLIGIALQDTSKSIVGLLYFTNNDGFEFAARVLKVEVRLFTLVMSSLYGPDDLLCEDNSPRQSVSRLGARLPDERHRDLPCPRQQWGQNRPGSMPPQVLSRTSS